MPSFLFVLGATRSLDRIFCPRAKIYAAGLRLLTLTCGIAG
jgi:hypothetical protein